MLFEHNEYRSYLRAVLADRIGANPAYSLRLFAMELGLAHPSLSNVLQGKKNLSPDRALRIARTLELSDQEQDYFLLLVQLEGAKDPELRAKLLARIEKVNPKKVVYDLSIDFFKTIADWYHFPILELTHVKSPELTPESAARRLGITTAEARAAIDRLLRLELLMRDGSGRLRKTKGHTVVSAAKDEPAIRKFNQQMLRKAAEALESQKRPERLSGTETIPIARSQLKEANALMEDFFQKMAGLAQGSPAKTDVYHLNVQFFNLTPERK